jgi:hypothetical protein
MFQYNGVTSAKMVYALSMTFVPNNTGFKGDASRTSSEGGLGAMHGFLDDRIFISMGVGDAGMATVELSVREEVLRGIRSCSTPFFPDSLKAWVTD